MNDFFLFFISWFITKIKQINSWAKWGKNTAKPYRTLIATYYIQLVSAVLQRDDTVHVRLAKRVQVILEEVRRTPRILSMFSRRQHPKRQPIVQQRLVIQVHPAKWILFEEVFGFAVSSHNMIL